MSDAGLQQFDPLRFHYIETLRRRADEQPGAVRQLLEQRLAAELTALQADFARAQAQAGAPDEKSQASSPLTELLHHIAEKAATPTFVHQGEHAELKAIAAFRSTWSKLSAGKQLNQAIEQAPENAGPLNSHMLVLRSLATMRDVSPDYLKRFMSYVDTLLCLEQADKRSRPAPKQPSKQTSKRPSANKSARR